MYTTDLLKAQHEIKHVCCLTPTSVECLYVAGGPFDILNFRKLHQTFLFSLLDLLSLDECWMQK